MNVKFVFRIVSLAVLITSAFMLPSVGIALYDGQIRNAVAYLVSAGLMALVSLCVIYATRKNKQTVYAQEGIAATGISWLTISAFGALPFFLSGEIPNYIDALFEIISGFTTTGASILTDVESLSRCNMYWRSFSHWLGGMGMLVFIIAVIPQTKKGSGSGIHLMRTESPGPSVGKFTPHLRETALILYGIYILLTVFCVVFLLLGDMPLFDSLCISFGTAGTGGFAIRNSSLGEYSAYVQNVVTVFMFLFGINFNIYFLIILRQLKAVFRNEELRAYIIIAVSSVVMITLNIAHMYSGLKEAFHHATFQVSSIMTTTGFASVDFEQWPAFSKAILLLLMFIGASAGSTGGGLKVSRVLLLAKNIRRTIAKTLNPRKIYLVTMDGKNVDESVCNGVDAYLAVYCAILLISFAVVSLDGFSIGTNFSAVTACFNNIGPGFELVGATGNYSQYSYLSKVILSMDMLLGRLEIFPLLALASPGLWSRKR